MTRRGSLLFVLLTAVAPLLALYPLVRVQAEWQRVRTETPEAITRITARGYDWVRWQDRGGQIVAAYVFPGGSAAEAGILEGDVFLSMEGQMLFDVNDLERVIAGLAPGSRVTVEVVRDGLPQTVEVPITRYPTFVYPLAPGLWAFSLWGFVVAAFLHVAGIATAVPLARGSTRARYALAMIGLSALWIGANLARLLLIEVLGPMGRPGSGVDRLFQVLTVAGITGWVAFPAVLLDNAVRLSGAARRYTRRTLALRLAAPLVLGVLTLAVAVGSAVGPFTLDLLVAPLVFYTAVYIALAMAVPLAQRPRGGELPGGYSRSGAILTAAAATTDTVSYTHLTLPTKRIV